MVAVSVSDNGPGIDEQTRLRIFEPFFTTREHGMGMGLSISMRIVELHGGKLECESEPDQGATFKFAVPIAQTKQELQIAGELADHMHS